MVSVYLKEIVPEQIEPPAQNQSTTGEAHDLPYLFPVPRSVAMHRAMLAGRFRIERALDTPGKSVVEKLPALVAETETFKAHPLQPGFGHRQGRFCAVMSGTAISGGKHRQDFEILFFLFA